MKVAIFGSSLALAIFAAVGAAPAAAQQPAERVGDWIVAKIAVSEGGNVCSALRSYGDGYAMEILQAKGLPGQLIMRLESPQITYKPGQTGENIEDPFGLQIVIGDIQGQEGAEAVVRQGPRGLGFVTILKPGDNPKFSPIRALRAGRSVYAYVGAVGQEMKVIGHYGLEGSGKALDALQRCVDGEPGAPAPSPAAPAAPVGNGAPIGPLGILPGHYVDVSVTCANATDIFYYDGARVGMADYDDNGNFSRIRVQPVGKVTREQGGALFLESLDVELHKLPGNRISLTIQDDGPPMRLCPANEIPAKYRVR